MNPYGLSIGLNASTNDNIVGSIMAFKPNVERLLTCHNFYPQKYTALGQTFFDETSKEMKQYNMQWLLLLVRIIQMQWDHGL